MSGSSARTGPRPKGQLTLLEETRRSCGHRVVIEDDEAGFNVDGDQVFSTPEWLAGKREADEQIAMGRGTVHVSGEAMFVYLKNLRVADGLS